MQRKRVGKGGLTPHSRHQARSVFGRRPRGRRRGRSRRRRRRAAPRSAPAPLPCRPAPPLPAPRGRRSGPAAPRRARAAWRCKRRHRGRAASTRTAPAQQRKQRQPAATPAPHLRTDHERSATGSHPQAHAVGRRREAGVVAKPLPRGFVEVVQLVRKVGAAVVAAQDGRPHRRAQPQAVQREGDKLQAIPAARQRPRQRAAVAGHRLARPGRTTAPAARLASCCARRSLSRSSRGLEPATQASLRRARGTASPWPATHTSCSAAARSCTAAARPAARGRPLRAAAGQLRGEAALGHALQGRARLCRSSGSRKNAACATLASAPAPLRRTPGRQRIAAARSRRAGRRSRQLAAAATASRHAQARRAGSVV